MEEDIDLASCSNISMNRKINKIMLFANNNEHSKKIEKELKKEQKWKQQDKPYRIINYCKRCRGRSCACP